MSCLTVSGASGAAPPKNPLMKERSIFRNSSRLRSPTKIVGTPGRKPGRQALSISMMIPGSGRGIMMLVQPAQMGRFWLTE